VYLKDIQGVFPGFQVLLGGLVLADDPVVPAAQSLNGQTPVAFQEEFGPGIDQANRDIGIRRMNG